MARSERGQGRCLVPCGVRRTGCLTGARCWIDPAGLWPRPPSRRASVTAPSTDTFRAACRRCARIRRSVPPSQSVEVSRAGLVPCAPAANSNSCSGVASDKPLVRRTVPIRLTRGSGRWACGAGEVSSNEPTEGRGVLVMNRPPVRQAIRPDMGRAKHSSTGFRPIASPRRGRVDAMLDTVQTQAQGACTTSHAMQSVRCG